MLRLLTRPRWLLRHAIVIGLCVAFVFLGRWQLHRGEARQGTIQNYGYAIEWPLFGVAVMFGWWKMLQDELYPDGKGKPKAAKVSPWHIPAQATATPDLGTTATTFTPDPLDVPVSTPVVARLGKPEAGDGFPKPLTTAEIDPDDLEVVRYNEWLAGFNRKPVNGYRAKAQR